MKRSRLRGAVKTRAPLGEVVATSPGAPAHRARRGTLKSIGAVAFIWLLLAVASAVAAAEQSGATGAVDLRTAIERTLARNPHLAVDAHRADEQRGRIQQVGLLPNPSVDLQVEDVGGSDTYEGVQRAQTTLSLGWVIEPTARRKRVAAAEAGLDLVTTTSGAHRLDAAAETAQWFLTALEDQARLENAGEAVELAGQTVRTMSKRVRAGRAPRAELIRAEAELALAELARDDVSHDLEIAYHRLAGQWGEGEPEFTRVEGDLLAMPAVVPWVEIESRLERNPRLMQLAAERRVAEASVAEARAERWMRVQPSIGMRHLATTDDFAVVAGLSMPLPVFSRSQGKVRETRASVARTRAEAEAARVATRVALFEAHVELKHHLHRAEALRDEVIPRLAEALTEMRRGFERGRYGYLEWRTLQLELLDARAELVEASVSAHRLVVALERLTGGEVVAR